MDKGSIEILKENLYAVNLSLNRLMYSFEKCSKIKLKDAYLDDERLNVYCTRYLGEGAVP